MITFNSSEGPLQLQPKLPRNWEGKRLPGSEAFSYSGGLGTLVLQTVEQPEFSLSFYHLQSHRSFSLFSPLLKGWHSVVALRGRFPLYLFGEEHLLSDGQFLVFHGAGKDEIGITVPPAANLEIWAARYQPPFYKRWVSLFPGLGAGSSASRLSHLLTPPIPARTDTIAAIREQFYQEYAPHLQLAALHLKAESQFFGLMAQAHDPAAAQKVTPWERKVANEAHDLIVQDIRVHYTNEEIADAIHVDRGALNRAFRLVYGLGMKEYLTWVRMERSKELLLQGEPIKKVAAMVGYKHSSSFSYEFRKLYHYSPVDFQNGIVK